MDILNFLLYCCVVSVPVGLYVVTWIAASQIGKSAYHSL